jgi:glutaredoxin
MSKRLTVLAHGLARALGFAALVLASGASHALYKVVGPDGKVTYTDVPPSSAVAGKITSLGRAGTSPSEVALPLELRQAVSRYPVTLFATGACEPCDSGRQLLRQRGIPFNERQVLTTEDVDALQRVTGGREAPALTIGGQTVRGMSQELWNSYLDAAGYPRESRLPQNYQFPGATPLTERREASRPAVPQRTATPAASEPTADDTPPPASSIKF